MTVNLEWDGDAIIWGMGQASGAAMIRIGGLIADLAKYFVHVDTGTLSRSIHAAALGTDHTMDQALARGVGPKARHPEGVYLSDIPGSSVGIDLQSKRGDFLRPEDVEDADGASIEVGSWVDYACVEETGRHHAFIHPAVEMVLPNGWDIIEEEVRGRGL